MVGGASLLVTVMLTSGCVQQAPVGTLYAGMPHWHSGGSKVLSPRNGTAWRLIGARSGKALLAMPSKQLRWHAGVVQAGVEARILQAHASAWCEAQGRYPGQRRRRRTGEVGWALRGTAWRQASGMCESLYYREAWRRADVAASQLAGPVAWSCDQDTAMHAKTARCWSRRDREWDLDSRWRQVGRATERAHEARRSAWNVPPQWKGGRLAPLYKGKGDAADCNSHRGLLIADLASKVFTSLLKRPIAQVCDQRAACGTVRMCARARHGTRDAHEQTIRKKGCCA